MKDLCGTALFNRLVPVNMSFRYVRGGRIWPIDITVLSPYTNVNVEDMHSV